jgi:hypothetical protein
MGTAYLARVVEKSGDRLKVHVFQTHPDYGLDPDDLLQDFGGFSVAGWAFDAHPDCGLSTQGWAAPSLRGPGELSELARDTGLRRDDLFERDAESMEEHVSVVGSRVVRPAYNDGNRNERLVEAGLPEGTELTQPVVMKICGVLELDLKVAKAEWLATTPVGVEWEY